MKTLQEQYNLILEGKGDKDFFMKSARRIFPQYINQYTSFNDATKILKSKSILTERFIGGLVTQSDKKPDWFKIFDENINEAKAIESKPTKEVVDMETKNYNYEDYTNIDNIYGEAFLKGYYAEIKDPKNAEKTVDEVKAIVAKNMAKDSLYYMKNAAFGVKGIGYKESTPTKEVKGKYKAAGVEVAPKIVKESKLREHISKIIKEELISEKLDYKQALKDFEKKWLKNPELKDKGIKHLEDALKDATGILAKQNYGLLGLNDEDLKQYVSGMEQLKVKYS